MSEVKAKPAVEAKAKPAAEAKAKPAAEAKAEPKRKGRGGARPGAGRKKRFTHDAPHRMRPLLSRLHPVHVVLRLKPELRSLRQRTAYGVFRRVLAFYLAFGDFRVVHISIQRNHIHLLVEARDREALRRRMQSFAIRAARSLNRKLGRRGKVFAFRYHATQIRTREHARHALSYVLNNWRRHGVDIVRGKRGTMPIDLYSSAPSFDGWSKRPRYELPAGYVPLPVSPPRTDLLVSAWLWRGKIDPWEVPGPASTLGARHIRS